MVGLPLPLPLPKSIFSLLTVNPFRTEQLPPDAQVGILAFEVARAMSTLVSLHRSLAPSSISLLQTDTIQSTGVRSLNSTNHLFLLRLACAELLHDLATAAALAPRLAARPSFFPRIFDDLMAGSADFDRKVVFSPKSVDRKIKKMQSFVSSAASLLAEMETLSQMDASEKRLHDLLRAQANNPPPGAEAFKKKLALQRKLVRKLQDESLWTQSKEKTSELISRATITIFIRISDVFTKFVPELPVVDASNGKYRVRPNPIHSRRLLVNPNPSFKSIHRKHVSGPLEHVPAGIGDTSPPTITMMKFSGPILRTPVAMSPVTTDLTKWVPKMLRPLSTTVGAAGLSLRYADLIHLVDRMFGSSSSECAEEERRELYRMLPESLRKAVKAKMKDVGAAENGKQQDEEERAWRVLEWLLPMATNTTRWFEDRNCEKQKMDAENSTKVLLLQTLTISDRRKTESAIVEVLVGLNFVYRDRRRRLGRRRVLNRS